MFFATCCFVFLCPIKKHRCQCFGIKWWIWKIVNFRLAGPSWPSRMFFLYKSTHGNFEVNHPWNHVRLNVPLIIDCTSWNIFQKPFHTRMSWLAPQSAPAWKPARIKLERLSHANVFVEEIFCKFSTTEPNLVSETSILIWKGGISFHLRFYEGQWFRNRYENILENRRYNMSIRWVSSDGWFRCFSMHVPCMRSTCNLWYLFGVCSPLTVYGPTEDLLCWYCPFRLRIMGYMFMTHQHHEIFLGLYVAHIVSSSSQCVLG